MSAAAADTRLAARLLREAERLGAGQAQVWISDERRVQDRWAHDGRRTGRSGRHRTVTVAARVGDRWGQAVAEGDGSEDLAARAVWAGRAGAALPPDAGPAPVPPPARTAPEETAPPAVEAPPLTAAQRRELAEETCRGAGAGEVLGVEYAGTTSAVTAQRTGEGPVGWATARDRLWHWTAGPGGDLLEGSVTWGGARPDPVLPRTAREELARARDGARPPPAAPTPLLLAPPVAVHLVDLLASVLNGQNALSGMRMLRERVGRPLAATAVTVVEDGRLGRGPVGAPVDHEGTATGRTVLVDRGVLRGFLHSQATAAACGHPPNGCAVRPSGDGPVRPGPRGFRLQPGTGDQDGLRRALGDGLELVAATRPVVRVNGGRTVRLEAYGWRVEGGRRAEPVGPVRVEVGLFGWLRDVRACGDSLLHSALFDGLAAPPVLLGTAAVEPA